MNTKSTKKLDRPQVLYNHTQIGYLMIYVMAGMIVIFGITLPFIGFNYEFIGVMLFVTFILASFSTLNVMIDREFLRIKFGYGIFRKRFLLNQIQSVKIINNNWHHGWGIRLSLWPYMWIYNISGLDAIELTMKNGRMYRIGTDEPKKLERVILGIIKKK